MWRHAAAATRIESPQHGRGHNLPNNRRVEPVSGRRGRNRGSVCPCRCVLVARSPPMSLSHAQSVEEYTRAHVLREPTEPYRCRESLCCETVFFFIKMSSTTDVVGASCPSPFRVPKPPPLLLLLLLLLQSLLLPFGETAGK